MKSILITGGAGFIGTNSAYYFNKSGWQVDILDNLSRKDTEKNLLWLQKNCEIDFFKIDIRNNASIEKHFRERKYDVILHLAAQVAVTTSVINPREDFEINAMGTFNILEAMRKYQKDAFLLYASTNKVYGKMSDVEVELINNRYEYKSHKTGVSEEANLDFHSPYGCSKGCADQYVIDYSRIYGLKTTSFRQSCIYGNRQFGVEDQGWVAWFTIASILGKQITVYGDGRQIRDILHVEDLIAAYQSAIYNQERLAGEAYNIGGGPQNTLSLLELIHFLEKELKIHISIKYDHWRPGDQKTFVCNLDKIKKATGWYPRKNVEVGIRELIAWIMGNRNLFE